MTADLTQTISDTELAELLDQEIPCGGCHTPHRECDRAAQLKGTIHDCERSWDLRIFKCLTCWQAWYSCVIEHLARHGAIRCRHCKGVFFDADSFAQYRSF